MRIEEIIKYLVELFGGYFIVLVPTILLIVGWMAWLKLPEDMKKKIKKLLRRPLFYVTAFLALIMTLIIIWFKFLPHNESYFGVYSTEYPQNKEIYLQRWPITLCNENNLLETSDEQSSDKYYRLYYTKGAYGFGFQLPKLALQNLSKYNQGNLCFSIRYYDKNIANFRIGVQSLNGVNTWTDLDINQVKGEWYQYKISLSQLRTNNLNVNFTSICQFFMIELEGASKGRIDLKEVFWETH